jgi:acyl-CoA synthetase (AMP-forming)/AMP-acid ligase II
VFGVPDERWGERVAAAVVAGETVTAAGLDEHCRGSSLADFKRPRRYLLVDELPRNATGKVQRSVLRQLALDQGEDLRFRKSGRIGPRETPPDETRP